MFINPEDLINLASKAIGLRQTEFEKPCILVVVEGNIICYPKEADHEGLQFVTLLSTKELTEGLSAKRWNEISVKLSRIFNKGCEIQPPQQQ